VTRSSLRLIPEYGFNMTLAVMTDDVDEYSESEALFWQCSGLVVRTIAYMLEFCLTHDSRRCAFHSQQHPTWLYYMVAQRLTADLSI
jgi:hypothetical protein